MNRVFDWDSYYGFTIRISAIVALAIVNIIFLVLPKEFIYKAYELKKEVATIAEELPPELEKLAEPPPVERPKLPVAAETPEEVEATTIEKTEFQEIIKKPTETDIPIVPFWSVEVKPQPVNIPKPNYPELAKQAGIEGDVVVKALVDVDGRIIEVEIQKSSGNTSLDQAALEAARNAVFTPAKQRDQYVRVWVSIPFKFRLK
ncbi:MAG: energy transducer TonB [candidate division WOR-3 bacterium]|nr:energy transducer TonB [candidate division WOR-3 bacterium]